MSPTVLCVKPCGTDVSITGDAVEAVLVALYGEAMHFPIVPFVAGDCSCPDEFRLAAESIMHTTVKEKSRVIVLVGFCCEAEQALLGWLLQLNREGCDILISDDGNAFRLVQPMYHAVKI